MRFQALFTYDADYQGYVVEVPELPGCFSQGKTLEEAAANIKDAINGVLATMEKHGKPFKPGSETFFIGEIAV